MTVLAISSCFHFFHVFIEIFFWGGGTCPPALPPRTPMWYTCFMVVIYAVCELLKKSTWASESREFCRPRPEGLKIEEWKDNSRVGSWGGVPGAERFSCIFRSPSSLLRYVVVRSPTDSIKWGYASTMEGQKLHEQWIVNCSMGIYHCWSPSQLAHWIYDNLPI